MSVEYNLTMSRVQHILEAMLGDMGACNGFNLAWRVRGGFGEQ